MCEVMLRIQQITGNKNRSMSFSFKKIINEELKYPQKY